MSAMEATVVATAMPTVVADLHGFDLYGWVGSIYMLASTVTIPLWGKLADLRGRKPVLLAGLGLFLLGSVTSGLSQSMLQLVVFRALQGIGAGSLQPVSLTIVGDLYSVEERAKVQGLFGAIWGTAGVAGPLLGGLIVHALSWRWVFYINVPFGLIAAAILVMMFNESARPDAERHLDWAGAALMSVAVMSLLLGVGGRWPGLTLSLSLAATAGFIAIERRVAEPIVPPSLFANRAITVASVAGTLMGVVMMSSLIFLPLYVQAVRGGSPTEAGSAVAPMLVGWPIAGTLSGRALARTGPRVFVRGGLALVALGTVATAMLLQRHASVLSLRVAMFVFGVGMGAANTALVVAVQESVGWGQRGVATASTMFFRSIGGAVSVGALGALLSHRLHGVVDEGQVNAILSHEQGASAASLSQVAGALGAAMMPLFAIIAFAGVAAMFAGFTFPEVQLARGPRAEPVPVE